MRSIVAGLAGVVCALAIAATLPVGWVAHHIADEDGYGEFTSSLVADSGIRQDVIQIITDDIVQRTGVSNQFVPLIRKAIETAASTVVDSAAFRDAFADAQRESHRALFTADNVPANLRDSDQVIVDLAPVAQTIVDSVTEDVPVTLEAPDQLLVAVGGREARRAIDAVDRTPQQTGIVAGIAAIAAGASLLFARRRSTMIAWLGVGTASAAGLDHLLAHAVVRAKLDSLEPASDLAGRAQQQLADAALASFDQWLVIAAVFGAAAVGAGLVARAVSR